MCGHDVRVTSTRATQETVSFTVDAALLRELGERLVGQPHIALAELIKNSYDADARHVRIEFDGTRITLEDDGHGMSYDDFVDFWMRVGTTHKRQDRVSPELERSYTGSKGVGRLAAQLLATKLEIVSVALRDKTVAGYNTRRSATELDLQERIAASVDWDLAVTSEELTSVTVPVRRDTASESFANEAPMGTRLTMTDLTHTWDEASFRALAQEIWALQPPFEIDEDAREAFTVELVSPYGNVVDEFAEQMQAIFANWRSVIIYKLVDDEPNADVLFELDPFAETSDEADAAPAAIPQKRDRVPNKLLEVSVLSRDRDTTFRRFRIRVVDCLLDRMECEIRIFNLTYRQANNVRVEDSRRYMRQFGGVHIYDGGFRLPYYGPQDWLDLERDHARRLSRSFLLPEELQSPKQLHDLPSARRVFGTARISTAHEAEVMPTHGVDPGDVLTIQVTRDRLVDNGAYWALRRLVRVGLDLYADGIHRTPKLPSPQGRGESRRPSAHFEEVRAAVAAVRETLGERTFQTIIDHVDEAATAVIDLEQRSDLLASLLGSLATVGMTTLAWDHEASKQRHVVMDTSLRLRRVARTAPTELVDTLTEMADELESSARSLDEVATLFKPILERSSRETVTRIPAGRFVRAMEKKLRVLGRGAQVEVDVPDTVVFPAAPIAAWSAVIQNLLVNAFNAVLDQPRRRINVDGGVGGKRQWLRIQDTGVGIDLAKAPGYFAPFARGMDADPRRAEMGLGGSGLGLTIVRMITDPLGAKVEFVKPDGDYATSVLVEWETSA